MIYISPIIQFIIIPHPTPIRPAYAAEGGSVIGLLTLIIIMVGIVLWMEEK